MKKRSLVKRAHELRQIDESNSRLRTKTQCELGNLKKRLDRRLRTNFEPWRFHDFRTAFATAMAEAGEPETLVDRVLNHVASGSAPSAVARVYDRSSQLPQRARLLNKWAEIAVRPSAEVLRLTIND